VERGSPDRRRDQGHDGCSHGEPLPDSPEAVVVGAYINDIQELDFKTNSYAVDLYVWFRWKSPDLDPSKTMEFMNRYAPDDDVRNSLYDKPKAMPDGSLYAIIRNQGRFSTKFPLEKYPFDTQYLSVVLEDALSASDKQIYVPDTAGGVSINLAGGPHDRLSRGQRGGSLVGLAEGLAVTS
jgi:hypothetical protein